MAAITTTPVNHSKQIFNDELLNRLLRFKTHEHSEMKPKSPEVELWLKNAMQSISDFHARKFMQYYNEAKVFTELNRDSSLPETVHVREDVNALRRISYALLKLRSNFSYKNSLLPEEKWLASEQIQALSALIFTTGILIRSERARLLAALQKEHLLESELDAFGIKN